ncbi:FHA domain-containing protein [Streptomyces sp. NBC_01477]|uniref:FHA domain-containing protein n=1 Tax=Streptomyces sp. NBC_01477 TaxID=2976015 RepID=UPI002E348BD5|nr:FHA domain-containing protein [Streptomyces sp. NBC_01477]
MLCPNGHESAATDWCETCGMRMSAPPSSSYSTRPPSSAASSSSTPPVSPQPAFGYDPGAASAQLCPACGTPREGMALFCEECRYNFQTHSATTFVPPHASPVVPASPPVAPTAPDRPPYQRYDSQLSRPSRVNRPAEPLPSESVTVTSGSGDFLLDPPSSQTAAPVPSPSTGATGSGSPAASGRGGAWLAVIGADREYFTAVMARSGPDASGLYFPAFSPQFELPLTGHQITIGRQRHSTGEAPDIDLSRAPEDPGVSHKHAVLVQQPDGSWSVVDQDSTNGTTVNLAEDPIPAYTPIPLSEGDRVHVGAWTTITIHRV